MLSVIEMLTLESSSKLTNQASRGEAWDPTVAQASCATQAQPEQLL